MTEARELLDLADLARVLEISREKPILLFKQSTTCPISASAFSRFNSFLKKTDANMDAFFVKVRESRAISDEIAEELGVRHESPQIFLVKDRQSRWHASHHEITEKTIEQALAEQ